MGLGDDRAGRVAVGLAQVQVDDLHEFGRALEEEGVAARHGRQPRVVDDAEQLVLVMGRDHDVLGTGDDQCPRGDGGETVGDVYAGVQVHLPGGELVRGQGGERPVEHGRGQGAQGQRGQAAEGRVTGQGIRARGVQVPPDLVAQALVDIRRRPAGHEHEVLHTATEVGGQLPGHDGAE